MLAAMALFLDSFWRALAYCVHPRVVLLSLLPLLLLVTLALALGYFYWEPALQQVRLRLESLEMLEAVWNWLQNVGLGSLKTAAAPLLVIFSVTPVLIILTLLVVAVAMTPAMVTLVAQRRFRTLERKRGASLLCGVAWSALMTLFALVALVVSLPLWLIPPMALVLPPLIWGWLTYRVLAFDALAEHASALERRELLRRHRRWFLVMGLVTGYLGAAPSLVWASGALFAAAFVILVPVAIWIYTLVFAFSSLWFAHYGLAALEKLRRESLPDPGQVAPPADPLAAAVLPSLNDLRVLAHVSDKPFP